MQTSKTSAWQNNLLSVDEAWVGAWPEIIKRELFTILKDQGSN